MQPDASPIPHTLAQWLGLALATLLAALGGWLARRKIEPHQIEKLRAETKSIHVTADNAQANVWLELQREIQTIVDKAEARREEWYGKEEQMRSQIVFWRNKSEELDGKLADAQEEIWRMQSELENYENQLVQMRATLTIEKKNYDDTKQVPVQPIDKPRE